MTPEQIDLLTRLQKFLRERMGKEKNGDMFLSIQRNEISYVVEGSYSVDSDISMEDGDIIIPLAIDPINPERGLWGMIDKKGIGFFKEYFLGDLDLLMSVPTVDIYTALLKTLAEQKGV